MIVKLVDYIRAYHKTLENLIISYGYKSVLTNTDFKIKGTNRNKNDDLGEIEEAKDEGDVTNLMFTKTKK